MTQKIQFQQGGRKNQAIAGLQDEEIPFFHRGKTDVKTQPTV